MAHASGNPTWKDWPDQSTQYTAGTTEAWENAIDRLYTQQFGASNRTQAQLIEGYCAATTLSMAVGNYYATGSTNWKARTDTDGLFSNSSNVYMQAALTGRYLLWCSTVWVIAGTGAQATFLTKNNTAFTSATTAVAFDNKMSTGSGTGLTNRISDEVLLNAGDKIYIMFYTAFASSLAGVAAASFGSAYTHFGMRWIAPS